MIKGDDLKNLTCIHRKHFSDIGCKSKEGTLVSIYYKYDKQHNQLFVNDYSIQFVIDGKPGINVADNNSIVSDDVYRYLFKTTYTELLKYVLTQIK